MHGEAERVGDVSGGYVGGQQCAEALGFAALVQKVPHEGRARSAHGSPPLAQG
ncbi:hypothetical protein [Streptomyces fructofermentans]|uniref:Uncharacterized protein n=1 Tax=Streptomyces fructofermentans TaxID=152141 RepID=A0A918NN12_9ACTN|nr:hypothetical protein [Streptomyces fructofermentans]GGX81977.1 hypothetical protein GCM10010515_57040 [Streptomyces fructofermentans]